MAGVYSPAIRKMPSVDPTIKRKIFERIPKIATELNNHHGDLLIPKLAQALATCDVNECLELLSKHPACKKELSQPHLNELNTWLLKSTKFHKHTQLNKQPTK